MRRAPAVVAEQEVAPTIASYDRAAAEFAERTASFRPERALAAFAACAPPGSLVLDAGSGPGRDCAYLAGLGLRPVALDLSRGMLLEGRRRGLSAPAIQADLRWLPFADGSFAAVWASAYTWRSKRERGKPGGMVPVDRAFFATLLWRQQSRPCTRLAFG
jgi:SAM-dependent methyltransferase